MKSPARWPGHFNWNLDKSNRSPIIVPRARGMMGDGLPHLLPDDPKNLLSIEARKRIQRVMVEAEEYFWRAEVMIEKLGLETKSKKAQLLRSEANFKRAEKALSIYRKEFSRLDIPEKEYRKIMGDEIEAASNSLELTGIQRQLLETKFFLPEDKNAYLPSPEAAVKIPVLTLPKPETIGAQINRLRGECRLSIEELAEAIELETRSVQRHIADVHIPHNRHLRAYERTFSKLLNRQVVIHETS